MGLISKLFRRNNPPKPNMDGLPFGVQEYLITVERLREKYQAAGFNCFDCVYDDLCERIIENPRIMLIAIENAKTTKKPLAAFTHFAICKLSAKLLFKQDCYTDDGELSEKGRGLIDILLHAASVFSATMGGTEFFNKSVAVVRKTGASIPQEYCSDNLSHEDFLHLLDENWLLDRIDPSDPRHELSKRTDREMERLVNEANEFYLTGEYPHIETDFISQVLRCIEEECERIDCLGIDVVERDVKTILVKIRDSNPKEANHGENPREAALLAIMGILDQRLASGKYHVYRGTLGLEGMGMKEIWEAVADRLLAINSMKKTDIANARKNLDDAIACVG